MDSQPTYRDDINLVCWKFNKPQDEHGKRSLFSSSPLLYSITLNILCTRFLLYLLTVDQRPRRIAHAAIFPLVAQCLHTQQDHERELNVMWAFLVLKMLQSC